MSTDLRLRHDLTHHSAFLCVLCGRKLPMNAIEKALIEVATNVWGHPSWRHRGVIPTYFLTADHGVFCRFVPNPKTGLVAWHWFHPFRLGKGQQVLIRGLDHFRELLETIQPKS